MTNSTSPFRSSCLMAVLLGGAFAAQGCSKQRPAEPLVPPSVRAAGVPAPNIDELLAQMTLDEKVGQMTQVSRVELHGAEVRDAYLGSVLNGGNDLVNPNTPSAWADAIDRLQMQALGTRLGIPLIYGVDAVHGHAEVRGATVFPHNIGLGATRNPELIERVGRTAALEIAATGIRWTFAPCIAVPRDERWGRTYEGFGETPELATMFGPPMVKGLQGEKLGEPGSVIACAKHYVADGATDKGVDQGDAKISEQELRAIHLPGYAAAVKAGVGSIMVSYLGVERPAHARAEVPHHRRAQGRAWLPGLRGLRLGRHRADEHQLHRERGERHQRGHRHGHDREDLPPVHPHPEEAGQREPRSHVPHRRRRSSDPAREGRGWRVGKRRWPTVSSRPSSVRRSTAQVARDAVRQSVVLLKNDKNVLPLKKGAKISVTGSKANDMGSQCGGWTVGWQGRTGAVTPGTTIQRAIQRAAGGLADVGDADAVVVVVGETPYAESAGDNKDLKLSGERPQRHRQRAQVGQARGHGARNRAAAHHHRDPAAHRRAGGGLAAGHRGRRRGRRAVWRLPADRQAAPFLAAVHRPDPHQPG